MSLFEISSIVIALSALFGYINVRLLKLPNTIGLMIIAILFTAVLFVSSLFSAGVDRIGEDSDPICQI